eukprot:CAMPEP_0184722514 /NCGR_PEP_ID=MMETSP0314-20130426/22405_1 /TAXON_ID=38298 /ORGANISM="Rhodella maculata, Strain CCMP 736" /LENGTH=48 /DNA_ID= /DNA_START= /DNA_END= /DNA_ORIENTATION=
MRLRKIRENRGIRHDTGRCVWAKAELAEFVIAKDKDVARGGEDKGVGR